MAESEGLVRKMAATGGSKAPPAATKLTREQKQKYQQSGGTTFDPDTSLSSSIFERMDQGNGSAVDGRDTTVGGGGFSSSLSGAEVFGIGCGGTRTGSGAEDPSLR